MGGPSSVNDSSSLAALSFSVPSPYVIPRLEIIAPTILDFITHNCYLYRATPPPQTNQPTDRKTPQFLDLYLYLSMGIYFNALIFFEYHKIKQTNKPSNSNWIEESSFLFVFTTRLRAAREGVRPVWD